MRTGTTVVVTAFVISLAGCDGSPPQEPAAVSQLPPPGAGPWDSRERALYREAVDRLDEYVKRNQRFLAAGRATPAAKSFYRDHLRDGETAYAQLEEYERQQVRTARAPVVLRTVPTSIQAFQDGAAHIVVERCTDQSDLGMTKEGEPLPPDHEQPVVQEAEIRRYENLTWRIVSLTTTDRPCDG